MSLTLVGLLVEVAHDGAALQLANGSMPAGRNGAYGHPETPVRNTAHWAVMFAHASRASGDDRLASSARRAVDYLVEAQSSARGGLICRHASGKDYTNGVLGQAFVLEAYNAVRSLLGDTRAQGAAEELIRRHRFNEAWGLWNRCAVDGSEMSPDDTFNHQLYFAGMVNAWSDVSADAERSTQGFLEHLSRTYDVHPDGRVRHIVPPPGASRRSKARQMLRRSGGAERERDIRYHLYNLYAFSILAAQGVDVAARVSSDAWARMISFARTDEVQGTLEAAAWDLPLKSGLETAVLDWANFRRVVLGETTQELETMAFLAQVLGPGRYPSLVSPDPVTQQARSYRYWRLLSDDEWNS